MNPYTMHSIQKKPWKKDNQIWRVFDISGGEIIASSPNQTWRGTIAAFKDSFVDATIPTKDLAKEIAKDQTWEHIPTGVRYWTQSGIDSSQILMENLMDGSVDWVRIEDLLNEFERVIE